MYEEETIEEFKTYDWWPTNAETRIYVGLAGHDRELVLNIGEYNWEEPIPSAVAQCLRARCPEHWKIEDRGTRIEVHPTGRLFNGFADGDVELLAAAVVSLGMQAPEIIRD